MTAARVAVVALSSVIVACGSPGHETGTTEDNSSSTGSTGSSGTPTGTSTGTSTDAPTGESTDSTASPTGESTDSSGTSTGGDTEMPALCEVGDGPGGALEWSLEGAALPGFMPALAGAPGEAAVLAGGVGPVGERDAFVELRDQTGAVLWSDVYVGANGLEDRALDVAVDPAGFVHVLVQETILSVLGEGSETTDARLVVLRYAPDGAKLWRWEHARAPVEPWGNYVPEGKIAADGQTITVLEWAYDQPFSHVRLDRFGNVEAEVELVVPQFISDVRHDLGADGSAAIALRTEDPQLRVWVGRFDAAGAPTWTDDFGDKEDKPGSVFVGRDGEAYLAWSRSGQPGMTYKARRYQADGAEAWTETLALTGSDDRRFGGAVRCDGALMLVNGVDKPPQPGNEWGQREDLWVTVLAADGAPQWTFEHEFGLPFSWGDGNTGAFTPSGAVIVSGSFLGDDGSNYQPWLGRLTGG